MAAMKSGGVRAYAGGVAEEVERDGCAFGDETGEEAAGLFGVGWGGRGVGRAEDGFDHGGRGRGKLLGAGVVEREAGGVDPAAEVLEGEEGFAVLVPLLEAGGGELGGGGEGWIGALVGAQGKPFWFESRWFAASEVLWIVKEKVRHAT